MSSVTIPSRWLVAVIAAMVTGPACANADFGEALNLFPERIGIEKYGFGVVVVFCIMHITTCYAEDLRRGVRNGDRARCRYRCRPPG